MIARYLTSKYKKAKQILMEKIDRKRIQINIPPTKR
jgi:hypothetical protein